MSGLAGQAVRQGMTRAGGSIVLAGRIVLALALLVALAIAGLAWRLSQGPVELPWLARGIASAATTPGRTVSIGHLTVSWAGFSHSDTPPLQVRILDVAAQGAFGTASLARADLALAVLPLLGGQVEPETADARGLRLHLAAAPSSGGGAPSDTAGLLRALAQKGDGSGHPWSRLRHLHLHDATAEMDGVPGRMTGLDLDLDRPGDGGLTGRGVAMLQAAAQQATLTLAAQVAPDGRGTELQADLTPLSPASLAGTAPQAAPLAGLDAPVTLSARASLGPRLDLDHAEASASVGAGTIHAGTGSAPLRGADLRLRVTAAGATLQLLRLETSVTPESARTRFTGQATATPQAGGYAVAASMDVDRVDFADLPALWPEGTGGPGTRPWMSRNITAGQMTNGHVEMDLLVPTDLSDVALRRIAGAIDGHDVTVHWLRPVPPLEHAEARLTVSDPDIIDITVASATQAGGTHGGLQYRDGSIHLTGIAGKDQFAEIRTKLAGPLPDLLAVLDNPRIRLLSKRPLPMRDPAGDVDATVHVGRLPLRNEVSMDDLVIDTTAHVTHTHLGGIAAGYDLSDGTLDLAANNDGLTVDGTASVAGFASRLKIGMDFRTGPPSQVQETVSAHSTVEMARLAALGVPTGSALGGSAELDTTVTVRRDGRTEIGLAADLARLTLAEPRMGIAKAAGQPGTASVRVVLAGDKLVAINALDVQAPGISVRGEPEVRAGAPVGLRLDRLKLGTGTDLSGEIRMTGPDRRISLRLSGPSLDLSPVLRGSKRSGGGSGGMGGRPWSADIVTDRVILGPGRFLQDVRAAADSDGHIVRRASITAQLAGPRAAAPLQAAIAPDAGGRRLTMDIPDTGALLRAAAQTNALIGGHLHVAARWADRVPGSPLAGVVEMTDFRVRDAPAIGRVLQALTVYGLVELARGPGLGFARLVAPFSLEGDTLGLHDARAFSASLGFTAQGRIDLRRRVADLSGTVVPAYFFNSLLGRVPLIGRLFSAEKGGGLFAAAVTVTGPLDDLSASVNPLSVVTPGFLRGLFGSSSPSAP